MPLSISHQPFQLLLFISKYVNLVLKLLLGRSFHSGSEKERKKSLIDFSRSAHSLRIILKERVMPALSPRTSNFFLLHSGYFNPISSIINDANASLLNVDASKAIFAVVPNNFNVYDARHGPFFYNVQYNNAEKIVTLPLKFMKRLAETIPDHRRGNNKVAVIYNTARCGSTLLAKMLEAVPNVVGISEPDALMNVQANSFEERAEILSACINLQSKSFENKYIFLKPRSMAVRLIPETKLGSPNVKLLFLYRNPVDNIRSIGDMIEFASHNPELLRLFNSLILSCVDPTSSKYKTMEMKLDEVTTSTDDNVDTFQFGILFYVAHILAYLHAKEMGVELLPVKYDDVLIDPIREMKRIFDFCDMNANEEELANCRKVMEADSQAGSILSRENMSSVKSKSEDFGTKHASKINETFKSFDLPEVFEFDSIFS